jgi:nitrite reductase (NO-forming)
MKSKIATRIAAGAGLALAIAACGPQASTKGVGSAYRTVGNGSGKIVEVNLDAIETVQEIAPGVKYRVWTFGGSTPAPVIRVTQGDTVRFTLTNKSTVNLSHSIDFHAAQTPWNVNYVPVAPGKSLTFDWVARFPGVFMYHCGVPPVLHHISNGMYGAIIVEPKDPLPRAREYVLVSSEFYAGTRAVKGALEGNFAAMTAAEPSHVVFNGRSNLHLDQPLVARPNELIRLWVMNAGPTLTNAVHVIGALFDHVYPDGNPTNVLNGVQTWNVAPGGGAMFELSIPDEGQYPFVNHSFAYTGLGALGVIAVASDAPAAPDVYPVMASPFDGGIATASGTVSGSGPKAITPGGGGSSAGGLTLKAANIAFDPKQLMVSPGANITFVNGDPLAHDFTIDVLKLKITVEANETKVFTLDAPVGTYEFYCSIPGHRDAGMVGTVVAGGH